MHYAEIKNCDVANGPGVRVTLFVSGCRNRCEGCFQPQTWDFHYGKPFTEEIEEQILGLLAPDYIAGLTLLGGEPFEKENQHALLPFVRRVRATYPGKSVWAFSGYRYEDELTQPGARCYGEETAQLLALIDVLVEGRFMLAQKDITLKFRGSRNQRILDLAKTRETGVLTLWDEGKRGI